MAWLRSLLLVPPVQHGMKDRDIGIDALRGYLLILMTICHMGGVTSFIMYEWLGYISQAEGFILISGLVCGLVYSKYLPKAGQPADYRLEKKCAQRSLVLYGYHIGLLVLVIAVLQISPFLRDWWLTQSGEPDRIAPMTILSVQNSVWFSTFILQPIYFDILPVYILALLALPWILKAFAAGKAPLVFMGSGLLWLFAQWQPHFFHDTTGLPFNGYFNFFAWQVLFVSGAYLGYARRVGNTALARLPRNRWLLIVSVGIVVLGFVLRNIYRIESGGYTSFAIVEWLGLADYVDKDTLGWNRVLNLAAMVVVVAALMQRYGKWFRVRPLAFIGRSSLVVFAAHIPLVYLLRPWHVTMIADVGALAKFGYGLVFNGVIIAILALVAWRHQHPDGWRWWQSQSTAPMSR